MRIEILHSRDPDSSCGHVVFVDGELCRDVVIEDVDPGAGHEADEWDEHTDWVATNDDYSPAFCLAVVDERNLCRGSRYIEGNDDDE